MLHGVHVQQPREIELSAFKRTDNKSLDLNQLEVQILNRFPSLERLTIHLHRAIDSGDSSTKDLKQLATRYPYLEIIVLQG